MTHLWRRLYASSSESPRKIIFDTVPRNPTGKIEKPKLRKMYGAEGLVAQQNEIKE